MNIDEEEFQDEFSTFGVNIDSEDIISKLRELCQLYRWVIAIGVNANLDLQQELRLCPFIRSIGQRERNGRNQMSAIALGDGQATVDSPRWTDHG